MEHLGHGWECVVLSAAEERAFRSIARRTRRESWARRIVLAVAGGCPYSVATKSIRLIESRSDDRPFQRDR
jgi:hypothetical protein